MLARRRINGEKRVIDSPGALQAPSIPRSLVWAPSPLGALWRSEGGDYGPEEAPQFLLKLSEVWWFKSGGCSTQKTCPKTPLGGDKGKGICQANGDLFWECCFPPSKRSRHCFHQNRQIERKDTRSQPQVVEVLDPSIPLPEADHGFEFFRHYCLGWIHEDPRLRQVRQQRRKILRLGLGVNVISEADVYLDGDDRTVQSAVKPNSRTGSTRIVAVS